jgi:MFS family permease
MLAFVAAGFGFASFAARAPAVKQSLDLKASGLGLLLVCLAVGAMVALPFSGMLIHHVGPARAVAIGASLESTGYLATGLGLLADSAPITGAGLFVAGVGVSVWDVAMNVEGAAVERALRRSIMARFHACFSLGTVLGAAAGATAASVGLTVAVQTIITAVLLAVLASIAVFAFTQSKPDARRGGPTSRSLVWAAWRTPRTVIVGVMVLAFAFTEGVANDWTAVALVSGLGASDATGALAYGSFVTAMTLGRTFGGAAVDRWGRVAVLRMSAATAAAGVLIVVVTPSVPPAFLGSVLWGLGAALGFPTGMSAAADDPFQAAIHVSVVTSIGYAAFLAGPPLVGFLGDHFGVRDSLTVVLVALALALLTARWAAPFPAERSRNWRERSRSSRQRSRNWRERSRSSRQRSRNWRERSPSSGGGTASADVTDT